MKSVQTRRQFLTAVSLAGAGSLVGVQRVHAAERALETSSVRILKNPGICIAPQYVAEELLREGKPEAAVAALQSRVRKAPSDPKLRVFLFQLLCVLGNWERARDQLKALAELDPGSFPLVHLYGAAINCELLRREVFAGTKTPLMLGEPLPWAALLLQALSAAAQGKSGDARALRGEALEQATAIPGTVDGQAFEWIADADSRVGPMCEAVIDGQYYWVPFERIRSIALEVPSDLRDFLWMPARLALVNGGDSSAPSEARASQISDYYSLCASFRGRFEDG